MISGVVLTLIVLLFCAFPTYMTVSTLIGVGILLAGVYISIEFMKYILTASIILISIALLVYCTIRIGKFTYYAIKYILKGMFK